MYAVYKIENELWLRAGRDIWYDKINKVNSHFIDNIKTFTGGLPMNC